MGILSDALDTWEWGARGVLDNDAFSIQDAGHAAISQTTGASTDKDEFAKESSQFFYDLNKVIATPGREFGEATQGSWLDTGNVGATLDAAGAGGEGAYEVLAEDLGTIAYGTTTGTNVRTNDPDHATAGYTPGPLESLELFFFGGGKAVATAGKTGLKGVTMLTKYGDEGSGVLRTASKTDEAAAAAKAGDDAVETQQKLAAAFAKEGDGAVGSLKLPDHLSWDAVSGSITKQYSNKKAAGVLGLGYLSEAFGFDHPPLPVGYTVDHEYTAAPGGTLVKETDNSDTLLGYWVVVGQDGQNFTVLNGGGGPITTSTVDFPTTREPPFASPSEADAAFTKWADAQRDTDPSGPTVDTSTPTPPAEDSEWEDVQVAKMLTPGWYLLSQGHKESARERFMVAGKDQQGRLMFVAPSGSAKKTMTTFSTSKLAMDAYSKWRRAFDNGNAARVPDEAQQRPTTEEIQDADSGGTLGIVTTAAKVAGAAAVIYLVLKAVFL